MASGHCVQRRLRGQRARVVDLLHAGAAVAALHGLHRRAFAAGEQRHAADQAAQSAAALHDELQATPSVLALPCDVVMVSPPAAVPGRPPVGNTAG